MSTGTKVITRVGPKLGIYEETTDDLSASLGEVKELADGRKFRLCFANGALTAGVIVQSAAPDAADDEIVVNTAAGVGDLEIEVTITAGHGGYTANQLKDGFVMVTKGTNCIGDFYKIKSHDTMTASTTCTIYLYDALTTAIAVSDEVGIAQNPWKDVVTGTTTAPIVGVPLMSIQDNYYFWAQFTGVGPGIDSGSGVTAGDDLSHAGGDVITQDGSEDKAVGCAINTAAANEGVLVNYTIM